MFTLYMEVVNSSQSVGFTKCRIIPSIYWMTHVVDVIRPSVLLDCMLFIVTRLAIFQVFFLT